MVPDVLWELCALCLEYMINFKKAVLSHGEPRDAAVNFDTYRIFARDSIYAIARICDRNSGRTSGRLDGRLSHGWIVQKRLKLGS